MGRLHTVTDITDQSAANVAIDPDNVVFRPHHTLVVAKKVKYF